MTSGPRPRWNIADVLNHTDLANLLDELTQPAGGDEHGRRWHCPILGHNDHHPSVTIHTDHRGHERWRCWSGDDTHRGDAIDLTTITQHLTPGEAVDWLAHRAGIRPNQPNPPIHRQPTDPVVPRFVPLDPSVVRYAEACQRILWTNTGTPIRDWLHHRGFTDALLQANHVGADPGRHMLPRRPGLPHGTGAAAVFPAHTPHGDIHYLQVRYLNPDRGGKYDNPAASLGTNPRLAWTRTPNDTTRPGLLIVCEGIPDALTAASAGYNAVAVLGAQAPDPRMASQLARHANSYHQQLVAITDTDTAGHAWGQRLHQLLQPHHQQPVLIEPGNGTDLNDWARHDPHWEITVHEIVNQPPMRTTTAGRHHDLEFT